MKKLHLICNAHIDPVWQWTYDEGISAALATFKSACDLIDEFDYVFCHNESCLYEAVEKNCPELFERIKAHVKSGKWKIMGGWYIQPDCLMPSGESFIRQIKEGHKYFKEKFGIIPEIAINFDSFGHSIGLVQILKKCGYKGYVATRPYKWNVEYPDGKFYRWIAPSGDYVLFTNAKNYGTVLGCAEASIIDQAKDAEAVDYVLWGVGNHGGGPSRKDLNDIAKLKIDGVNHFHSTLEDLFSDDIKISADIDHSLVTCMAGCYSSMAKVKQAHRQAENILYTTEKMLAVASLAGYKPDLTALKDAQKKLLLAEFHDILPGTCIADGEENGLELLNTCKNIAKEYRTNAFMYLTMGDPPAKEGEYPIYVFNPMPYEIIVPIEAEYMFADQNWSKYHLLSTVYQGDKEIACQEIKEESNLNIDWRKRIIFTATLKPMGMTRFSVFSEKIPGFMPFDKPAVPASIDGLIKESELKEQAVLEMYDDTADPWGMSAYEQKCMGKNPEPFRLMTDKECKKFIRSTDDITAEHLIEDGEVLTAVEGFYTKDNTNAVIEYRKYKGLPYIDLKVTVEFSEKNRLIKLRIPAPKGVMIGDGPFVIEEKPLNSELSFQKWLGVKQDDGKVFAVINDGVHSGIIKDGYIYLTLLRGAGYCMHPLPLSDTDWTSNLQRKLYPTDRYLPRIDSGRYTYRFRLMTGTVEEVTAMSELFNQKTYAVNVFPIGIGERKVEISTDVPVVMPTMKIGENGGYVMRFFNPKLDDKTFTLTVNGNSQKIKMAKAEVVSVIYEDSKFTVCHDIMAI